MEALLVLGAIILLKALALAVYALVSRLNY